jgi:hypothetical protein
MSTFRYRLIDTSGSEIGLVDDERQPLTEGDTVVLPDGSSAIVLEVYDDEFGREGGVEATIVVDET